MSTNELTNKIRAALFVLLAVFAIASTGWAATYYVDVTNGNDFNSGTTPSTPWKYCPGMSQYSGMGSLRFGDIVYFNNADTWTSAGNSYDHVLTVTGGVTYDGSTWGTGTRAKFQVTADPTSKIGTIIDFSKDHATIPTVVTGFELDGGTYNTSGVGVAWPRTPSPVLTGVTKRIQNCVVHDCGKSGETGFHYGIMVGAWNHTTTSNVEVLNNTVYNTGDSGIAVYGGNDYGDNIIDNVLLRSNDISGAGLSPLAGGLGIFAKNHVTNSIIEFNYVHACLGGIDIIGYNNTTFPAPENLTVRYNIITGATGSYKPGMMINNTLNPSAEIYGNIIYSNNGPGIKLLNDIKGTVSIKIYNNTLFTNGRSGGASELYIDNFTVDSLMLEIKNNIFYTIGLGRGWIGIYEVGGKTLTHSNNIHYNPYNADNANVANINGTIYYKNQAPLITAWEATGYATNPNFKNASNLPTGFTGTYGVNMVPNNDGLSISSGEAIGHGADLSTNYNGAINLSGRSGGITRPRGSAWDISAYQYTGSTPVPPSNFRILQ